MSTSRLADRSRATATRPRQRRWFLEVRERKVYLVREGEELSSFSGMKMGAIMDVSIGKEHSKGRQEADNALMIIFEDRRKGIVSRENFEWNKNDFCKEFKSTKNAVEFVEKFQSLTTFDRVQQIVLQNLPDPPPENPGNSQLEVSVPENGDPSTTRDNPQDDETTPEGDHIVDEPPSAKKQKTTDLAQMGADVASKKVGLMDIQVKNCIEPPTFRLLRRIDPVFVLALKKRLKEDPSGIGIPPLAVQCKDIRIKDGFEERLKNVYHYEVLGGLHGVTARQELNMEGFKFETVSCHVYAGLSDEEALWLSSRHNANGHFQHRMTHRDYVEACRSRLYVLSGKDPSKDETPMPSIEWKRACTRCILPEDISRTQRENIFCQAGFVQKVYKKMQTVMNMYEDGDLKDQKLNKKQLTAVPEFKQHHMQPLHNLKDSFQSAILQRVIDKELSLKEMKDEADKFRALEAVRKAFVRCTSSQNWEDAVSKFPTFTTEDRLTKFTALNFKQSIPDPFRAYCQSALNLQIPAQESVKVTDKGIRVAVVCGPLTALSAQKLKATDPAYSGAQLILVNAPKNCNSDTLEGIAYASRQLNSASVSLNFFTLIMLCELEQLSDVKVALLKYFDSTETAYIYNKSAQQESGRSEESLLTPALRGIVVGYWSQEGKPPNKLSANHHNVFTQDGDDSCALKLELINTFTHDGHTVIDATGSGSVAAAQVGRNMIYIEENPAAVQEIWKDI